MSILHFLLKMPGNADFDEKHRESMLVLTLSMLNFQGIPCNDGRKNLRHGGFDQ